MTKRGRPSFRVTEELRRRVAIAKLAGASHLAIANSLGISRNTLEFHFESELAFAAVKIRSEMIEVIYRAAKRGNVAACKAYLANQVQHQRPIHELLRGEVADA